ncbi:MAG TPA: hypothetical protein VGX96_03110 [Candidatus Elarobacter sp.]|nr:hypothetical protein [Candidatus Elarobacter sp.]
MVRMIVFASLAVVLLGASPPPTVRRFDFPMVQQQAPLPRKPAPLSQQPNPASGDQTCRTAADSKPNGAALPPELRDFVPNGGADDATVCRAMRLHAIMAQKAAYEYYANDVNAYHLRANIFQNQAVATNVILVVVIIITLAGLVFSGIQFWVALTTHAASLAAHNVALQQVATGGAAAASSSAPAAAAPDDTVTLATQLKVGMDGVQVQSSILGTTILVFSLAFLYLYLKFVYPINDVTMNNPPPLPVTTSGPALAK